MRFRRDWGRRAAWVALAAYTLYALSTLEITWERFLRGLGHGGEFLARMWPPNLEAAEARTDVAGHGGVDPDRDSRDGSWRRPVASARPARCAKPDARWISWIGRIVIALCRSFHPIIVAILFVKAVGFGALAGILALVVASMGFVSKLFAEAIEEINLRQVEAVRATGAGFANTLIMGVMPQVMARFVGFSAYQLNSNLRNSTMVGIVGGGGIGAALFTAYQRFDFDFVLTILIVIIAVIMVSEVVSAQLRRLFQ